MSKMREAMESQSRELARLLADAGPAKEAAARLKGRRLLLVGIGTSWHAAHHGASSIVMADASFEVRIDPAVHAAYPTTPPAATRS